MADEKKSDRMPWAFAIGVAAAGLGVVSLFAGAQEPAPFIWLGVGLVLICTGLIQRSIEKTRR